MSDTPVPNWGTRQAQARDSLTRTVWAGRRGRQEEEGHRVRAAHYRTWRPCSCRTCRSGAPREESVRWEGALREGARTWPLAPW